MDRWDPLLKRERVLEQEPWASMRVTGFIEPADTPRWLIRRFEVPEGDRSQQHEMLHLGRYAPPGVKYTGLWRKTRVGGDVLFALVMSDTPDELTDHGPIIKRAAAASAPLRVLVNGLGLGCVTKGLLAQPNLAHVDVVEVDWDLIRLVGPAFVHRRPGLRAFNGSVRSKDHRITIHHADAFCKQWPATERWDLVWHDVWDSIDPANLRDEARAVPGTYDAIRARYTGRCEWQGAWGEVVLRGWPRGPLVVYPTRSNTPQVPVMTHGQPQASGETRRWQARRRMNSPRCQRRARGRRGLPVRLNNMHIDTAFETLVTERLLLRRSRAEDAETISAYRSDPEVHRYQGWERTDPDGVRAVIVEMTGRAPGEQGGWVQLSVEEREGERLVGDVGLCPAEEEPGVIKVGYTMAPAFQGKGYATEAVGALVAYAFERLGVEVVRAYASAENAPSIRVAEKVGMRLVERFEGHEGGEGGESWSGLRYELRRENLTDA